LETFTLIYMVYFDTLIKGFVEFNSLFALQMAFNKVNL